MNPSEDKLRKAFTQALGLPGATDVAGVAYGVTEQWDSIAHMQLVASIEGAFDIMLDTDEVIALSDFGKAKEIVGKHGVSF